MSDYEELPKDASLKNWIGKKVTFVATPCNFEYQQILSSKSS
jgi:hypothetical protein